MQNEQYIKLVIFMVRNINNENKSSITTTLSTLPLEQKTCLGIP